MAYFATISGPAGLRGFGNEQMNFLCTATSCSGKDPYTDGVFRAFQAQLNRWIKATKATQFIVGVDGKIGAGTVATYKFIAQGLAQNASAAAQPPVPANAVSKETLASQAEVITRFLQQVGDRAGLPPAGLNLPAAPSPSSGSFSITPDQAKSLIQQAQQGQQVAPTGPDQGLPASELVSGNTGLMSKLTGKVAGVPLWVVLLGLAAVGGGGYYWWRHRS